MSLKNFVLMAMLATAVAGHGFITSPRIRGALNYAGFGATSTNTQGAPMDTCPHCLNAGGPQRTSPDGWSPYEPMKGNKRSGFGICGDPAGSNDHMKSGQFANPPSKPFVADYQPGSVANFEFTVTANHRGYLEFYLCDVDNNPGKDIQFSTFGNDCQYLERVANPSCESGNDPDCGPIDPKFPGRWVLPCGVKTFGGENSKMAYRIPNKKVNSGVVHMYWLAANSCHSPDGFTKSYKYPSSWCKIGNPGTCGGRSAPEEFWNCADVTVGGGGPSLSDTARSTNQPAISPQGENELAATTGAPYPIGMQHNDQGITVTTPSSGHGRGLSNDRNSTSNGPRSSTAMPNATSKLPNGGERTVPTATGPMVPSRSPVVLTHGKAPNTNEKGNVAPTPSPMDPFVSTMPQIPATILPSGEPRTVASPSDSRNIHPATVPSSPGTNVPGSREETSTAAHTVAPAANNKIYPGRPSMTRCPTASRPPDAYPSSAPPSSTKKPSSGGTQTSSIPGMSNNEYDEKTDSPMKSTASDPGRDEKSVDAPENPGETALPQPGSELELKQCKALLATPWPNGGGARRRQCWNLVHCTFYRRTGRNVPRFCK